jgi:hypothetical protein
MAFRTVVGCMITRRAHNSIVAGASMPGVLPAVVTIVGWFVGSLATQTLALPRETPAHGSDARVSYTACALIKRI